MRLQGTPQALALAKQWSSPKRESSPHTTARMTIRTHSGEIARNPQPIRLARGIEDTRPANAPLRYGASLPRCVPSPGACRLRCACSRAKNSRAFQRISASPRRSSFFRRSRLSSSAALSSLATGPASVSTASSTQPGTTLLATPSSRETSATLRSPERINPAISSWNSRGYRDPLHPAISRLSGNRVPLALASASRTQALQPLRTFMLGPRADLFRPTRPTGSWRVANCLRDGAAATLDPRSATRNWPFLVRNA